MPHRHNELAEKHLDVYHSVHNHGWVALVDYMGNDMRVAEAARQSTSGKSKGEKKDRALIRYMLENGHSSPFEMVETVWHVRMPIFVMRQWVRHRTASLNEYSGRYSKMKPEFYVPTVERGMSAAKNKVNTQGSTTGLSLETAENFQDYLTSAQESTWNEYEELLELGFSNEMARINLPLSTYTTIMWKMDLRNLLHFFGLRLHKHAQYEIRAYAEIMYPIVKDIVPIVCEAWEEFFLNAKTLSSTQVEVFEELKRYLYDQPEDRTVEYLVNLIDETGL